MPQALTIFAFEIVFGQPASELFAGQYEEIQESVRQRARGLLEDMLAHGTGKKQAIQKLQTLRALVEAPQEPEIH